MISVLAKVIDTANLTCLNDFLQPYGLTIKSPSGDASCLLEFKENHLNFINVESNWNVFTDFSLESQNYRQIKSLGKKQGLFKAVGLEKSPARVVDGTAGLGGDAFRLASRGLRVLAVEKNPQVLCLTLDGVRRALMEENLESPLFNIQWVFGELQNLENINKEDVIYLDPMFPEKKKGALSNKEMQALQILTEELATPKEDESTVEWAIESQAHRVVVKRPLKAPALCQPVNHTFKGNSIRYDLYLSN